MKVKKLKISIPIIALFYFVIAGCAPITKIYKIDNSTSKDQLIKKFNSFSSGKTLKIELKNGSCLTSLTGTSILHYTLFTITGINKNEEIIPQYKIKNIKINGTQYGTQSAYVELKNSESLNVKNVKFLPDSKIQITTIDTLRRIVPLDSIKEVIYKDRLLGLIPGVLGGAGVGAAAGLGIAFLVSSKENADAYLAFPIGGAAGALIGGIIGYINGYNYTFIFNNY